MTKTSTTTEEDAALEARIAVIEEKMKRVSELVRELMTLLPDDVLEAVRNHAAVTQ